MGGDRETIAIQTKKSDSGKVEKCGEIRYHENAGEVHFHDDANKLKVAIPSGVWYKLYQNLIAQVPATIIYPDTKNRAVLHASTKFKKAKKGKTARVDFNMHLETFEVDARLAALQKFTEG